MVVGDPRWWQPVLLQKVQEFEDRAPGQHDNRWPAFPPCPLLAHGTSPLEAATKAVDGRAARILRVRPDTGHQLLELWIQCPALLIAEDRRDGHSGVRGDKEGDVVRG